MPIYISSFIARGGAGKTTSTLHLAGALHLQGYSVALVDADIPQCTLSQLSDNSFFYIHRSRYKQGASLQPFRVFSAHEADARIAEMEQPPDFIITDCTPRLSVNDYSSQYIAKSDICLIPTQITYLGIGKDGEHVMNSLKQIRNLNKVAKVFLLINQYPNTLNGVNVECMTKLGTIARIIKDNHIDDGFNFDPEMRIRDSQALANFGREPILFNPQAMLAYTDFIQLARMVEAISTQ